MRSALLGVAAILAAMFAATAASAAARGSDVDFLRASRCKGLASQIKGVVNAASLDAYIKSQSATRDPYILERGDEESQRAAREARSEDSRGRLTAELTGACQAYLGETSDMAKR